jgi:hypothetical protein
MTRFGKILVLCNLALSLIFAAWALAFRTDRIDWTAARVVPKDNTIRVPNPSGKQVSNSESKDSAIASVSKDPKDPTVVQIKGIAEGSTHVVLTDPEGKKQGFDVHVDQGVPGKLSERIDEIRDLQDVRHKAEADYEAAHRELTGLERQRPEQQKWYAEQQQLLERGDQPVNAVVYSGGAPQIDNLDRPVMAKASTQTLTTILPRESYLAQLDRLAGEIKAVRADVAALVQKQTDLTAELKTVRAKLAIEDDSLRKLAEERAELTPRLYNREAAAQDVRDIRQRLDARLQELKRAGGTAP